MSEAPTQAAAATTLDPVLVSVMANRLDGIVREMTNTLLRAARSAVISSARDFSCCIVTGDNQLLASAEGLPVHIFGTHVQTAAMAEYHQGDMREGDAFLHNDRLWRQHPCGRSYLLVPVFVEGEHLFTTSRQRRTRRISATPSRSTLPRQGASTSTRRAR